MKKLILAALLLVPTAAIAQQTPTPVPTRFEVTPFLGYIRGGSIQVDDSQLTDGEVDVKVENGSTWGLKVEQTLSWGPDLRLQYMFQRMTSQLEDNRKLFGEVPSGPVPPGNMRFTNLSVNYLHVGAMWLIGEGRTTPYDIRPFVAGGIGLTQLGFKEIPLDSQTRPSISGGGGIQWALSDRMGLRFEARGFLTSLGDEDHTERITNRDCIVLPNNPCVRTYSFPSTFIQGDLTAGVSYKF